MNETTESRDLVPQDFVQSATETKVSVARGMDAFTVQSGLQHLQATSDIVDALTVGENAFKMQSESVHVMGQEIGNKVAINDRAFSRQSDLNGIQKSDIAESVAIGSSAFEQQAESNHLGNKNSLPVPQEAQSSLDLPKESSSGSSNNIYYSLAKLLTGLVDFRRNGNNLYVRIKDDFNIFRPLKLKGAPESDFARFVCHALPAQYTSSMKTYDFNELHNTLCRYDYFSPLLPKMPDYLVRLRNGILNVLTGEFTTKIDPSLCFVRAINAKYLKDTSLHFPDEINSYFHNIGDAEADGATEQLLAMFGIACSNYRKIKVMAFVHGPKNNGKSTSARLIQRLQIGSGVASVSLKKFGSKFDLGSLQDCLLTIDADYDTYHSLTPAAVSVLKKIVGRDLLSIEKKHVQPVPQILETFPVFFGNELPQIAKIHDPSSALMNRAWNIPTGPSVPEDLQDRNLETLLWKYRDIIVTLALQIAMRFIRQPSLIWRPTDEEFYSDLNPFDAALLSYFNEELEEADSTNFLHLADICKHFVEKYHFTPIKLESFGVKFRAVTKLPKSQFQKRDNVSSVLGLKFKSKFFGGW